MPLPICASLYIHVPFCASGFNSSGKCDYCDFYSVPVTQNDKRMALYVDKILDDVLFSIQKFNIKQIPIIFIGGGTPSVLGSRLISRLLNELIDILKRCLVNQETTQSAVNAGIETQPGLSPEISIEANPESCDDDFLTAVKDNGVNRISLGVQTFHKPSRQAVGRQGEGRLIAERLKAVSQLFPHDFSIDLISGLPFQDEAVLLSDIEKVLAFEPGHISLYALTVEPQTPLGIRAAKSQVRLPARDEADTIWLSGRDALENAGYAQYEVSNFCMHGKECRHNLRYWRMENWLGIGPAASGTIINEDARPCIGQRFTNAADVDKWLARKIGQQPPCTLEMLDTITLIKETFLMGFRLSSGPDNDLFMRRFGKNIADVIPRTINAWQNRGLFCQDRAALTRQGLQILDAFLIEAFDEVDTRLK